MNGLQPWLRIVEQAELHLEQHVRYERSPHQPRMRALPYHVIVYVHQGSCRLRLEGREYRAEQGELFFIAPFEHHHFLRSADDSVTMIGLHFSLQVAECMDALQFFEIPSFIRLVDNSHADQVFRDFLRCSEPSVSLAESLMTSAKASELIAILLEAALVHPETRLKSGYSDGFTTILIDLLHHPEERIDLASLGKRYHMHPTYISNQFKKIFGITPIQLQLQLRLRKAMRLLKTEQQPISEVAKQTGYEDVDDFSRFFKSRVGISPLKFRNEGKAQRLASFIRG